jgi:hypothetical protein
VCEPHALSKSHVLVRKAKYDLPTLAGLPPPKFDRDNARSLETWGAFFSALFKPWTLLDGSVPDMSFNAFVEFYASLEHDARLFRPHEAHDDHIAMRLRNTAHCRISKINGLVSAMNVPQVAAKLVQSHRARMRDLWEDKPKPSGGTFDAHDDKRNSVLRELRKQLAHLEKMATAPSLVTRLTEANNTLQMQQRLMRAFPAELLPRTTSTQRHGDRLLYKSAIEKDVYQTRTYTRPMDEVYKELLAPLPPKPSVRKPAALKQSPYLRPGVEEATCTVHDIVIPSIYAFLDDDAFQTLLADWDAADTTTRGDPPMNPGQRQATAAVYRVIVYRSIARARKDTPLQIYDHLRSCNYSLQNLITGMGGSGKSQIILHLEKRCVAEGIGHVISTAFTGVAAAPFGSATLQSLFNISIRAG